MSYHGHNHSNDEGNPGEQNLKRNRSQSGTGNPEARNPTPIVRENKNKDAHNRLRADGQEPEEDPVK